MVTHHHFKPQNMVFQPQNTQPQNISAQPQNRKIFCAARSLLCSRVDEILRHAPDQEVKYLFCHTFINHHTSMIVFSQQLNVSLPLQE